MIAVASAAPLLADTGAWVWGFIVVFWLVTSLVSSIRQAAKKSAAQRAQAAVPAAAQQLDTSRLQTVRQIGADAYAGAAQAADDDSADAPAPDPAAIGKQVMAQILAARDAIKARAVAAQASAAQDTVSARQALASTLQNVLDEQTMPDAQTSSTAPGSTWPQRTRSPIAQGLGSWLHAPGGLALAVLAGAVIGPCTALKTEPQEPGGW